MHHRSRTFLALVVAGSLTAACSTVDDTDGAAGHGGAAGSVPSGGSGGLEGPPFEVGPRQYGSYLGFDTQGTLQCTVPLSFVYYAPVGHGPFPIFVFAKGSRAEWDDDSLIHEEMLQRMATLGFVAVSPDYQSNVELYPGDYGLTCQGFREKSRCMFAPGASHPESLVAVLERDTLAESTQGIAISGISQGGFVALLAGDHNEHVRAANPMSIGTFCGYELDWRGCTLPGAYAAAPEGVRIVNGESDALFGGNSDAVCDGVQPIEPAWYREQLNAMAAMSCDTSPSTYECLRPDGSGWILARDEQVASGPAHHAFPYADYPSTADPNWAATADPWGRQANQAWMAQRIASP